MPTIASLFFHTNNRTHAGHPLLFLHGSGRTEADGADFVARLATGRQGIFVRAPHPQRRGYTFILREDDFSLNHEDIASDANDMTRFSKELIEQTRIKKPILIGYSSGAIMSAAMLWQDPSLYAGAILLRPQSPSLIPPPTLNRLPILLLPAARDERRSADDAAILEQQLQQAGAAVTLLTVQSDHAEASDGSDITFIRNWLEDTYPNT